MRIVLLGALWIKYQSSWLVRAVDSFQGRRRSTALWGCSDASIHPCIRSLLVLHRTLLISAA